MRKADGLSRRLDWKIEVDKDNKNQVVIKDSWVCRLEKVIIEGPEAALFTIFSNYLVLDFQDAPFWIPDNEM